ncbi:hypothetical protein PVK06_023676 [Gossypium arboreum]|uniref:Uncharacterized protein n=1 Tax=Gossypium arboreum TaxID=29729 RepID=A0ABR0PBY8_GOSAR|nr:hypothetical protein PVK06_023676 [Gossypium arboreum]
MRYHSETQTFHIFCQDGTITSETYPIEVRFGEVYVKVLIVSHYEVIDRSITGKPGDGCYAGISSNFSDTRRCSLINIMQKFKGIIIGKICGASHYNRCNFFLHFHIADICNLPSYPKASTAVDVREHSSGQQLLWCNKGDVPFRKTTVVVIKQSINNYNHCYVDSSFTSTMSEYSLFT